MLAARYEYVNIVRLLGRYAYLGTSLFAGAYLGLIDVVEMQLDTVMEDIMSSQTTCFLDPFFISCETPLLVAAARGHAELVRYMQARGAELQKAWLSTSYHDYPHYQREKPYISLDMLRVLLEGDCDPSVLLGVVLLISSNTIKREERDSGVTLTNWRSDAIKLCLNSGAEVTADCMMVASEREFDDSEALSLLFELRDLSAVVNCEFERERSGLWSPLRMTLHNRNYEKTLFLLQHGAILTSALFEQMCEDQKNNRKFSPSQRKTLRSYVAAEPFCCKGMQNLVIAGPDGAI
jgi:hypothetical protein